MTAFGNTLHITGEDEAALQRALSPFFNQENLRWKKVEPSLEDVFIHLMKDVDDNFQ